MYKVRKHAQDAFQFLLPFCEVHCDSGVGSAQLSRLFSVLGEHHWHERRMPSLATLHLQGPLHVSTSALAQLGAMSARCQTLELVHAGAALSDETVAAWAARSTPLRMLSLCHTGAISDASLISLSKLERLHTVRLARIG